MTTVIIGVGNPVLSDDSVGLKAAGELHGRLRSAGVDSASVCCGGIELMEALVGYDRAVIVDAMISGAPAGTVRRLQINELLPTRTTASLHDGSLREALELGRAAGLDLPADIRIWAVEAGDTETVGEWLTPPVERALHEVVEQILADLAIPNSGPRGSFQ